MGRNATARAESGKSSAPKMKGRWTSGATRAAVIAPSTVPATRSSARRTVLPRSGCKTITTVTVIQCERESCRSCPNAPAMATARRIRQWALRRRVGLLAGAERVRELGTKRGGDEDALDQGVDLGMTRRLLELGRGRRRVAATHRRLRDAPEGVGERKEEGRVDRRGAREGVDRGGERPEDEIRALEEHEQLLAAMGVRSAPTPDRGQCGPRHLEVGAHAGRAQAG